MLQSYKLKPADIVSVLEWSIVSNRTQTASLEDKKLQKQMYLIYIYPDKRLINNQPYECSKLQIQNFLWHNSTALQEEKQKRIHTTDYSILHKYYGNYLFPA